MDGVAWKSSGFLTCCYLSGWPLWLCHFSQPSFLNWKFAVQNVLTRVCCFPNILIGEDEKKINAWLLIEKPLWISIVWGKAGYAKFKRFLLKGLPGLLGVVSSWGSWSALTQLSLSFPVAHLQWKHWRTVKSCWSWPHHVLPFPDMGYSFAALVVHNSRKHRWLLSFSKGKATNHFI